MNRLRSIVKHKKSTADLNGKSDGKTSSEQPARPTSSSSASPSPSPSPSIAGPSPSTNQLRHLVNEVKDYQLTHGSLLKLVSHEENHTVPAKPIGVSLVPTPFPRSCFEDAWRLQSVYNELYAKIASDEEWLHSVLEDLIAEDAFAAALWKVHLDVKQAGAGQDLKCGIFRSDYMVHSSGTTSGIKQVEFNTFSVAGGVHANKVADMHTHLERTRRPAARLQEMKSSLSDTIDGLVHGLSSFYHSAEDTGHELQKCVLMIVDPDNYNVADERPLEYGLWERNIPTYRCLWKDVLSRTTIRANRELRFHPPMCARPLEVAVVYYRAGYQAEDYDEQGTRTRLLLELSRAIKCPDILGHLATFKRVQQTLTMPGALEHFLDAEKAAFIRQSFMPMYTLDGSKTGLEARKVALDPAQAVKYVLKPNLEGGGHNVYKSAIPAFLRALPQEQWHKYVLMELINTQPQKGYLMSPTEIYTGPVVSELGIFGTCLWQGGEMLYNETAGWSFKTKRADVDEMSVAKGYGCFDSPRLVG